MAFVNLQSALPPCAPDISDRRGQGIILYAIRMGQGAEYVSTVAQALFEGWIPHDDGASEGCLALATDVGVAACPK